MAECGGIVVYTALLGGYDALGGPGPNCRSADFVCFCDETIDVAAPWRVAAAPADGGVDARIRRARYYKTHPHTLLGEHAISIWIDANLRLTADPAELVAAMGEEDVAAFAYPSTWGPRDCLYQEALACIERGKDDSNIICAQMRRYISEGYPAHNGLAETSIVVRRNTERVARMNGTWWDQIARGSRRDQLSFNFSLWRHALGWSRLAGARRENPYSEYRPHLVSVYPA